MKAKKVTVFDVLKILIFSVSVSVVLSCEDLFVVDISDKTITVLTPLEGRVYTDTEVSFFWEPLEGASVYHIQVFKPSYLNMQGVCYDTICSLNSLKFVLAPDKYEWRIRAENDYYRTEYFYNKFEVNSSNSIP